MNHMAMPDQMRKKCASEYFSGLTVRAIVRYLMAPVAEGSK